MDDAKIKARQARDAARRDRILNPSTYRNGVDLDAVKAQITAREAAREAARVEGQREAETLRTIDTMTMAAAQEADRHRKAQLKATLDFRQLHQRMEMRDSWELNNPNALKEESIDDKSFGVSSVQRFEGEDEGRAARVAGQRLEMVQWTMEAAKEHARETERAQQQRLMEHRALDSMVQLTAQHDREATNAAKAATARVTQTNIQLAAEERKARKLQKQRELEESRRDIESSLNGILKEDPSLAFSPTGKILTDRFKGFSQEQVDQVRQSQREQAIEMETRRAQQKQEVEDYGSLLKQQSRQLYLMEREAERARKLQEKKDLEENMHITQTKKVDTVHQNEIDSSFYAQFQTSCR